MTQASHVGPVPDLPGNVVLAARDVKKHFKGRRGAGPTSRHGVRGGRRDVRAE